MHFTVVVLTLWHYLSLYRIYAVTHSLNAQIYNTLNCHRIWNEVLPANHTGTSVVVAV